MARAFIAVGSNINPAENVRRALIRLAQTAVVRGVSTVYLTEPVGCQDQASYYNCVIEVETDVGPQDFKCRVLLPIETSLGRTRTADRYAARTIDLDLILYGDLVVNQTGLVLPDPDIVHRAFLAAPLCELAPDLVLPGSGRSVRDIAAELSRQGMRPLDGYTRELRSVLASARPRRQPPL